MFDPAVMGTLLIGLDGDRVKARDHRRHPAVAVAHRERLGLRQGLANARRRAAAVLDRPTVGEVANQG